MQLRKLCRQIWYCWPRSHPNIHWGIYFRDFSDPTSNYFYRTMDRPLPALAYRKLYPCSLILLSCICLLCLCLVSLSCWSCFYRTSCIFRHRMGRGLVYFNSGRGDISVPMALSSFHVFGMFWSCQKTIVLKQRAT